ncbi:MAG: C39 family peptidase [Oligoflexia bacterium]|nr:C39 family peptidase [Oligoflexia bacterium]
MENRMDMFVLDRNNLLFTIGRLLERLGHLFQKEITVQHKLLLHSYSYQQTTDYTCGPASLVTLLHYYGFYGDELMIATEMGTRDRSHKNPGTSPQQMVDWLETHGFSVVWGEEATGDREGLRIIRESLINRNPILVEWIDWGGHWALVVGYLSGGKSDGSEDTIILADPAAHYNGNKSGLTYANAERFYSMWFDAFCFEKIMRRTYIIATPRQGQTQ